MIDVLVYNNIAHNCRLVTLPDLPTESIDARVFDISGAGKITPVRRTYDPTNPRNLEAHAALSLCGWYFQQPVVTVEFGSEEIISAEEARRRGLIP